MQESIDYLLSSISTELDISFQFNFNNKIDDWEKESERNGYSLLTLAENDWDAFIDEIKEIVSSLFANGLENDDRRIKAVEKNRKPRDKNGKYIKQKGENPRVRISPFTVFLPLPIKKGNLEGKFDADWWIELQIIHWGFKNKQEFKKTLEMKYRENPKFWAEIYELDPQIRIWTPDCGWEDEYLSNYISRRNR